MADSAVARREWAPPFFIALSAVTFSLLLVRLASRFQKQGAGIGFDDLFISLAWIFSSAATALLALGTYRDGFDRHLVDIPADKRSNSIEIAWILDVLYLAQIGFIKVSILLFYRRLVSGTYSPRFKWAIWISITVVGIYTLVMFILLMIICNPVQATWLQFDPAWAASKMFYCTPIEQDVIIAWVNGIVAIATDFSTALLPAYLYAHMQLSRRTKVSLSIVFVVGFLTIIPGTFRLIYLVRGAHLGTDSSFDAFNAILAGKVESDFGLICACAPCLQVLFQRYFRRGDINSIHTHSRPGSGSNSRSASRSNSKMSKTLTRNQSRQSNRSVDLTLSPGTTAAPRWTPSPSGAMVMIENEQSISDIPEAYADDVRSMDDDITVESYGKIVSTRFPARGLPGIMTTHAEDHVPERKFALQGEDYGRKRSKPSPSAGDHGRERSTPSSLGTIIQSNVKRSNSQPRGVHFDVEPRSASTELPYLADDISRKEVYPAEERQLSPSSWLNTDASSVSSAEDDERELTGQWYPGAYAKEIQKS